MTHTHSLSKNFFDNIRSINNSLAFVSLGANIAPLPGSGPYCLRIHGGVYHRVGKLHPSNGDQQKFAQLYVLDADNAAMQRMQIKENANCHKDLLNELGIHFSNVNPFADAFKMLFEVENESLIEANRNDTTPPTMILSIVQDRKFDQRRYNAPKSNEIAFVF